MKILKKKHAELVKWVDEKEEDLSKGLMFIAYLIPTLFFLSLALAVFNLDTVFKNIVSSLIVCNLLITLTQLKKIKKRDN